MKTISRIAIAAMALAGAFSCKTKEMNVRLTDVGPDVTVSSCDQSAFMGGTVSFSALLEDDDFDLSTLKASLLFDETSVADTTIRTKTEGTYSATLSVPFMANIPDGTATLRLAATNVGTGVTTVDVPVKVYRPVFDHLDLLTSDGTTYTMTLSDEEFVYEVEGSFPAEVNATISGEYQGVTYDFGWAGTAVELDATDYIPFSNGVAGNYAISFSTYSFEASPFVSLTVNGTDAAMLSKDSYAAVVSLSRGGDVTIEGYAPGFSDWTIDEDFFEDKGTDGTYGFLASDGLYRIIINVSSKFLGAEKMSSTTETGTLETTGSVWMIGGSCYGKPSIFTASWDPENDGLCFAEVEDKVHQLTFTGGVSIATSGVNVKIFHQKSWGGEFGYSDITTDSDLVYIGDGNGNGDNGNIYLKDGVTLEIGGVYRFTLDLNSNVLHFAKVGQVEVEQPAVTFAGTEMTATSTTDYEVTVSLTKGQTIEIGGISDLSSYWIDPDYFTLSGSTLTFNAASGNYKVKLNTSMKYTTFLRMKDSDSSSTATLEDGHGLWMMGWGGAHPVMTSQFGWDTSNAYSLAEVDDLVFQLTGIAVAESDGETMGGRLRTDYISIKYFSQQGWGNECGKPYGTETTVTLTERASSLIKLDGTNISLADGVTLEEGQTYVLSIDLSKAQSDLVETIDFYRK